MSCCESHVDRALPDVGAEPARLDRGTMQLIAQATRILGTCIVEAPETARLRRRKTTTTPSSD